MSEFRAAAVQLAGIAGVLLGWRPEDFWQATPQELATIFAATADAPEQANPASPNDIQNLMEQFPDG